MSVNRSLPEARALNGASSQRLDKWLWFARAAKTRSLAAALISEGKVRVNGKRVEKIAALVRLDDVVTIVMRQHVRTLKVLGFAERRGSAEIASALFEDRTPKPDPAEIEQSCIQAAALREPGSGRPTKRDRRELDRLKYRSE